MWLAALVVLGLWTVLSGAPIEAAEIKVLSTVGMQPATVELFTSFEAATGHKIIATYGLAAVLRTRVLEGASADVLILSGCTEARHQHARGVEARDRRRDVDRLFA